MVHTGEGPAPRADGDDPVVLSLRSVSKRYGDVVALRGISLTLRRGEAVGYLGPNGAGKTTTLKILAGLARPDSGEVSVAGVRHDGSHRARDSLGVLVETPGVLPYMRGTDLLSHVAEVRGLRVAERAAAVRQAADRLGVGDVLSRPLGKLSTGQLRRVQLAATLVGAPDILLLDEPTLGLDPAARVDLRALLRQLRNEGHTLFLTTHLVEDVQEVCDRVLFLREGRLVGDEAIRRDGRASDGHRTLVVRTLETVDLARVSGALPSGTTVLRRSDHEVAVTFEGDEGEQRRVLGALVTAGVGVVEATADRPDLAARYMALVGREEVP